MTPDQRISDCRKIEREIRNDHQPWFSSSARLRQQDMNYISGNFTRCVNFARDRGLGDDVEVARELVNELRIWNHQGIVN